MRSSNTSRTNLKRANIAGPPHALLCTAAYLHVGSRTSRALAGTAVAGCQWPEGSIHAPTARTGLGCAPGGGHAGSEPTRTQLSAASPSEPRGRPSAGASGPGSGVARGVAARLRPCRHEGWDPALRFGAGFGGYSSDAGNKPQPSVGPSPRPACAEVPGNRSTPFCLLYGSVPRRVPVTRKANVPATRWASFACLRHSVSSQQDPGLQPDDHQKKPAGRTHAQREAAGHR
jgi:hypothetical protein